MGLGREAKIGMALIGGLLVIFAGVLTLRLMTTKDKPLASLGSQDATPAAESQSAASQPTTVAPSPNRLRASGDAGWSAPANRTSGGNAVTTAAATMPAPAFAATTTTARDKSVPAAPSGDGTSLRLVSNTTPATPGPASASSAPPLIPPGSSAAAPLRATSSGSAIPPAPPLGGTGTTGSVALPLSPPPSQSGLPASLSTVPPAPLSTANPATIAPPPASRSASSPAPGAGIPPALSSPPPGPAPAPPAVSTYRDLPAGQTPTYRETSRQPYSASADMARPAAPPAGMKVDVGPAPSTYGSSSGAAPRYDDIAPAPSRSAAAPPPRTAIEPRHNPEGSFRVMPGDNYWTISEQVYGTGAYFNALAEHNRGKMARDDRLAPGTTLQTPSVAELRKNYPDLCPRPNLRPRPSSALSTVSTMQTRGGRRTYKVVEGDTLFEIAKHELGKGSRWAELYQLNRDRLGDDYDYLTPGMELILPDAAPAARLTQEPSSSLRR